MHGDHVAQLGGALEAQTPGDGRQESGAECVSGTRRLPGHHAGNRGNQDRGVSGPVDPGAAAAQGRHDDSHPVIEVRSRPPGLVLGQRGLVLVGKQVVGARQQRPDLLAIQPGELPRRVGGERDLILEALLGEREHRVRVAGADQDKLHPARQIGQVDLVVLGHGARIERGDLVHVNIGRADVPGRMVLRGLTDPTGVDTVGLQPIPVVGEVGLAGRADQQGPQAQAAKSEGDVRRHPAPPYHQRVDQE